jgi:hypothetical protein
VTDAAFGQALLGPPQHIEAFHLFPGVLIQGMDQVEIDMIGV